MKEIIKKYISRGLSYSVILTIIIYTGEKTNSDKTCLLMTVGAFVAGVLASIVDRLSIIEKAMRYIESNKQIEEITVQMPDNNEQENERRKSLYIRDDRKNSIYVAECEPESPITPVANEPFEIVSKEQQK